MVKNKIVTKTILLIALIVIVLATTLGSQLAFASTPTDATKYLSPLVDYDDDGKQVNSGFSFKNSSYFGMSSIALEVYVYNSDVLHTSALAQKVAAEIDEFARRVASAADTQAYLYDDETFPTSVLPSDLYRFNHANYGDELEISKETYDMLQLAYKMYDETEHAYNPASYRLVDLWGFSSRVNIPSLGFRHGSLAYDREPVRTADGLAFPLPEDKYINAFIELADFSKVVTSQRDGKYYVSKNCPNVTVDGVEYSQWIDLGGIAKGYIVDGVRQILQNNGLEYYYINSGGSSIALSSMEDGSAMNLMLESHHTNMFFAEYYATIPLKNVSISTSGLYVRKYTYDGVTYSHIINSETGYPATSELQTVTVASSLDSGVFAGEADCWTTALTVQGRDYLVKDFLNNQKYTNTFDVVSLTENNGVDQIVTNLTRDQFVSITDGYALATSVGYRDGNKVVVYNPDATPTVAKKSIVVIILAIFAAAIVVYLVVKIVLNSKVPVAERVAQVRKDKFFKLNDVIIYMLVALLILVLFFSFIVGKDNQAPSVIVVKAFTGHDLLVYDVGAKSYYTTDNQDYTIEVEELIDDNGKQVITITLVEKESNGFNIIEITNDNGSVTAKVVDADCGINKECVNYFPDITSKNDVIVCNPHRIKIVANRGNDDFIVM